MKILVLCYEYPPLGGGGGRVAQSIATEMVTRGHEVRVQTAALGWHSVRESIGGVEIHRTASGRRAPDTCRVHEMAAYCATSFLPTLRHIREWRPDVIHAHFAMPTGLLAWAVHRLTGVPYVLTAHLGDVPGGAPGQTDRLFRAIGPFARLVWREAAEVTAVSAWVCELATRGYGRKPVIIRNGVKLGDGPPSRDAARTTKHLAFVGRLNPQKCPLFLIDVLSLAAYRDWRLTIVGDGDLMPALRWRIADAGLQDRVHLTGWLEGHEVERVLHDADIFFMPSTFEGLPVAATEALKHGLALVVSDIPGLHDVVSDGENGYRLPPGDARAWCEALGTLLDQPARLAAMQRASWNRAQEFDLHRIAGQYEAVLGAAARRERYGV